jgi:hypothetical protein
LTGPRFTYTFGPIERRGLLGPVRAGQALVVALGVVLAIAALDTSPNGSGAILATLLFASAAAAAVVPVGSRTAEEWAPVVCRFVVRLASGRARYVSPLPRQGMRAQLDRGRPVQRRSATATPPGSLRDVRIAELQYRNRPIGVLSEQSGRRLTAVLACRAFAFALLDAEGQERRLARWGLVLSGAANTPIRRLQWIERTVPAQGDELVRWLHDERDPAIPLRGAPMVESYLELIGTTARVAHEHELLVAVQVDARKIRGRGGQGAVGDALIEEAERVALGLEAAEVTVVGALNPGQMARVLRTAFDPYARAELAALEAADSDRDGLPEAGAWPIAAREAWDHYRSDGAVHATYWISGWPRVEVSPMFMDALLARSSAVRSVAVTFEPLPPERSTREVEAAITRDRADRELRHRFGQLETARQRQSHEATLRREAELAAGHSEVRLSGFVTVSGRDEDELRRATAEVLEHAARARLELHRMYGQQAEAFTFTLPLCRGLR